MSKHVFHSKPEDIILYVVPGSQYSTKVLAGVENRKLPHFVDFANPRPEKRVFPSGAHMVPEIEYKNKALNDSTKIFEFLDEYMPESQEKFFPDCDQLENIKTCNEEAEDYLDCFCDYFNYVDDKGYKASVRQSLASYIPWWAFWISIDRMLKEKRGKATKKCQAHFSFGLGRAEVETALLEQLKKYDELLETSQTEYLFSTKQPSAADLAVFSKICRMLDHLGDVSIGAAYPELLERASVLSHFVKWYEHMRKVCPMTWKGKRIK